MEKESYIMKKILENTDIISYKNKEEFLALLLILEKQEKQDSQEPAFVCQKKGG